jgi:Zn-dependent protease
LDANVIERLLVLVPFILSLTVHECAHAWSAWKLGDDTALRMGRLTLNPLPHIDVLGTLILPIVALLTPGGMFFGWAKPVPVDPTRFSRKVTMRTGMVITAAAGPASNVVMGVLCAVILGLLARWDLLRAQPGVQYLLVMTMQINVALALFNLIPVPPLDGSRIVDGLMPYAYRSQWEAFTRAGPFLLLAVFFLGGYLLAGPINVAFGLLLHVVYAVAT